MPYSSGTFSLYTPGNPVVTGTTISSTWANNTLTDIATGLSTAVLKDGSQTLTANIPMGTFKLTGLGAGNAAGNSLRYEQLYNASGITLIGDLLFTDASFDIGKAGATRPRDVFLSRNLTVGGTAAITGHVTLEGVTSTGAQGSGALVFATSPTLTTAVLGSSTATTQTASDNSTKVATTAYIDRGAGSSEVLIGTIQTASGSATIDFTAASYATAFNGTFGDLTFHWEAVRPATDAQVLKMQMGTGAGPTFDTGANYDYAGGKFDSSAASFFGAGGATYISLSGEATVSNNALRPVMGAVQVACSFASTAFHKFFMYDQSHMNSGDVLQRISGSGRYAITTAVTGVRFFFAAGNIAEGRFWVTGKRLS